MRTALVMLALSSSALADPPSVSSDGKRIQVPYRGEDGAQGRDNLTVLVENRAGKLVQRIPVVDVENGPVKGGQRAWQRLRDSSKWEPMVEATAKVELADNQLTFTPPNHAPIVQRGSWRVTPTMRKQAEIDHASALGEISCFNAAELGQTWIDVKHRAAVVFIRFHGSDSCWEPDSDFAIVTW